MREFGEHVPLFTVLPFVIMLGGIAIIPLVAHHWWESNRNRGIFAAAVSAPIAIWLIVVEPHLLGHSLLEYVSFLALLGSLYVVSGGIHVSGDLEATPARNTGILLLGSVLANLVGTTGASMLLIRTILRTNSQRKHRAHVPFFFILTVSNCGGLLTPLGDPPLFLGYLRGVPFTWTLSLFPWWVMAIGYLLVVFYFVDRNQYRKESQEDIARDKAEAEPLKIHGGLNALFLAGIVGAVFLPTPFREITMTAMAVMSVRFGAKSPRAKNGFTYGPILEVAILFAGIFVTMVPALALLEARGSELGLTTPWQYYLVTGGLSSVLDNAPTYLTFLSAAQSLGMEDQIVGMPTAFLTAISCAAVFMGANTYIGNGPNFMVKAIAEESGYSMPSFGGYALRAVAVLVPIYIVQAVYFAFTA